MKRHQREFCLGFLVSALVALAACDNGPTQPTPGPIVTPAPVPVLPAPPPPPPPAPPPVSTAPWFGFVGTEAEGFVLITATPEATGSYPQAINESGQVVGRVAYGTIEHAFIWSRADGMKDLGVLPGGTWSAASAINSKGQVAGASSGSGGRWHAFRWSAESGMVDLGLPAGCVSSWGTGINNSGDIVGYCVSNPQSAVVRPFLWTESRGMEDLGTLSNDKSGGALAINDRGQIVGYSAAESYYDDVWRAALWTGAGSAAQIDNCAAVECSAWGTAINSGGDVAGSVFGVASVWMQGGKSVTLGNFGDGNFSVANAINDHRQIVGYTLSLSSGMRAFVWTEEGGVRRLDQLPGTTEMFATGINNKGEITGYSR